MTKLTLALALSLTAAAAAHAQTPNGNPGSDPVREALRLGDSAKVEEAHINASRRRSAVAERAAASARRVSSRTFKAEVAVTNHAAKPIRSVSWTATLTDPGTGSVIRSYDVTTKTRIAPGTSKKLSKHLRTPAADRTTLATTPLGGRPVADLKVEVTGVTYADGSTSTTP
ncbi:MAG TPA: hypothetical protein VF621_17445 [Pyrinomonadaceae bacterium]|jgi:hypothetical protein